MDLAEDYLSLAEEITYSEEIPEINLARALLARAAQEFANRSSRDRIGLIDDEGTRRGRDKRALVPLALFLSQSHDPRWPPAA